LITDLKGKIANQMLSSVPWI